MAHALLSGLCMSILRQRGFLLSIVIAGSCLLRGSTARGGTDTDDDNFREDVIECEQAASHLRECCPNATSAPDCHYYTKTTSEDCGCSGTYVSSISYDRPISIDESKSIQNSSCDELATNGTCDQVWDSNAGVDTQASPCSSGEGY